MGEWRECKLGDVTYISTGYSFKGDLYEFSGSLRAVRGENITEGILRWDSEKFWNHSFDKKYLLEADDIVIGMDGSKVGKNRAKIKEADLPLILAQRVARIKATNLSNQGFIWYTLFNNNFVNYVESIHTGTSIPHISMKQIADYEILVPPLEEQKAIAEVLSSLDDKIDLLHRQNKTLEELAQTLFRQWFIEEAREEWEEKPLSFFGDIICGKTPSKSKPEYFEGNIPFIKIPDMHGNAFIFNTTDTLTNIGKESQKNKTLLPKSICVSCIATVGLVSMNIAESQTNQQINSIVPNKDIYRYFLYLFMKSSYDLLHAMASGGTATLNLNTGDFSKMEVLKPDDGTLKHFHDIIEPTFDKIFINSKQIQTLENLRDTLLPKLMSGEVRVEG